MYLYHPLTAVEVHSRFISKRPCKLS